MLSSYSLNFLKNEAPKFISEDEACQHLDYIVSLISFIPSKDRFLHNFVAALSKRLLNNDQSTLNFMFWDKYFVKAIKSSLGSELSNSLELMIQEVDLSVGAREDFSKYLKNANLEEEILQVNILAKSTWLKSRVSSGAKFGNKAGSGERTMVPPNEILGLQKLFQNFYLSRTENLTKDLEWVYDYGKVEFKANFEKKSYIVHCKPYHFFVLIILGEEPKGIFLSIIEIGKRLGATFKKEDLEIILVSFSRKGKLSSLVLKNEKEEFGINYDF